MGNKKSTVLEVYDNELNRHFSYFISPATEMYHTEINYQIGDDIVSKLHPERVIGKCTGFTHDNACILIDNRCYGGKYYFMKSEWQEIIQTYGGNK
jgi:hypothetical protein